MHEVQNVWSPSPHHPSNQHTHHHPPLSLHSHIHLPPSVTSTTPTPHSLPLALNTPLNPFISLPNVSLTTYNFIFQYPTHPFLSPSFQPFTPIFHSCTQESHSHHHTRVRTTHLILHNLPCIPIRSFMAFPTFVGSSTRAWEPCKHGHLFIPTSLSTPRTHFSNAHETHFSHQYSFLAHSHPFSCA